MNIFLDAGIASSVFAVPANGRAASACSPAIVQFVEPVCTVGRKHGVGRTALERQCGRPAPRVAPNQERTLAMKPSPTINLPVSPSPTTDTGRIRLGATARLPLPR